ASTRLQPSRQPYGRQWSVFSDQAPSRDRPGVAVPRGDSRGVARWQRVTLIPYGCDKDAVPTAVSYVLHREVRAGRRRAGREVLSEYADGIQRQNRHRHGGEPWDWARHRAAPRPLGSAGGAERASYRLLIGSRGGDSGRRG